MELTSRRSAMISSYGTLCRARTHLKVPLRCLAPYGDLLGIYEKVPVRCHAPYGDPLRTYKRSPFGALRRMGTYCNPCTAPLCQCLLVSRYIKFMIKHVLTTYPDTLHGISTYEDNAWTLLLHKTSLTCYINNK